MTITNLGTLPAPMTTPMTAEVALSTSGLARRKPQLFPELTTTSRPPSVPLSSVLKKMPVVQVAPIVAVNTMPSVRTEVATIDPNSITTRKELEILLRQDPTHPRVTMLMLEVKRLTYSRGISASKALNELLKQRKKILNAAGRPADKSLFASFLEHTIGNRAGIGSYAVFVGAAAAAVIALALLVSAQIAADGMSAEANRSGKADVTFPRVIQRIDGNADRNGQQVETGLFVRMKRD